MQKEALKTLLNGVQASIPFPNWESTPQEKGYIHNKPFYKYKENDLVLINVKDLIGITEAGFIGNYWLSYPQYDIGYDLPVAQVVNYPLEPIQLDGFEYEYYAEDLINPGVTSAGDAVFTPYGYDLSYFMVIKNENNEYNLPVGTYINTNFWSILLIVGTYKLSYPTLKEMVVDKFKHLPIEYINFDELPKNDYDDHDPASPTHIINRPCYDSRTLFTVSNPNSSYTFTLNGKTYYLLNPRQYSVDDLVNYTLGVDDQLFILKEENLTYFNREKPDWISICLPNGAKNYFVANKEGEVHVYLNNEFVVLNIPKAGLYVTNWNFSTYTYQNSGQLKMIDEKYLKSDFSPVNYNTNFQEKVLLNLPCYEDNYIVGPKYSELVNKNAITFNGGKAYLISEDVIPFFVDECTVLTGYSSIYDDGVCYSTKEFKEEDVYFSSDKKSFYIKNHFVYANTTGNIRYYLPSGSYITANVGVPGLYYFASVAWDDRAQFTKAVCFKGQTFIKKLDPKFLPSDLIANGN